MRESDWQLATWLAESIWEASFCLKLRVRLIWMLSRRKRSNKMRVKVGKGNDGKERRRERKRSRKKKAFICEISACKQDHWIKLILALSNHAKLSKLKKAIQTTRRSPMIHRLHGLIHRFTRNVSLSLYLLDLLSFSLSSLLTPSSSLPSSQKNLKFHRTKPKQ